VDKRDLSSVLRLFAEIASSVDRDDAASVAPDGVEPERGGEEYLSARDHDAPEQSNAAQ